MILLVSVLAFAGPLVAVAGPEVASAAPVGRTASFGSGIKNPRGIVTGSDGNLWFGTDTSSIGRMTPGGTVTTFTAPGIDASSITAGPDGNLWFTNDYDPSIGKITPAGVVSIFTDPTIESPIDITSGPDGNLWFTNAGNNSIGKITPVGAVSNFTAPSVDTPWGIVAGPDGALWFTSRTNNAIGKITVAGVITTYTVFEITSPAHIAAGADGNLWFTNLGQYSLGKITPAGAITMYSGLGPAEPTDIAAGADGNLWVTAGGTTYPGTIARVSTTGTPTIFSGPGIVEPGFVTPGPDGNVWFTNSGYSIGSITPSGTVSTFVGGLHAPESLANGPDGNLWFTNNGAAPGYADSSIGRITPTGQITEYHGTGVKRPTGIAAGPDGNLWFTNAANDSIGTITPAGVVSNFTGTGISDPAGIVSGPDGNLWFANTGNNSIGKITPAGAVSNFTGTGISRPLGIVAAPDGNLWFTNNGTDPGHAGSAIGKITPAGVVSTYQDQVGGPGAITVGPDGALWFTNRADDSIGRITTGGQIQRFTSNAIRSPFGIATGPDGNLWFTNPGNGYIGRITPQGAVTPYPAGNCCDPQGIVAGPDGNMWFANHNGGVRGDIGRITPTGAPDAPSGVFGVAGNVAQVAVAWTAPVADGGYPVTSYTVTAYPGGSTCSWTSGPLSCTVTGLANATPYTFTVTAANSAGTSLASPPSAPVTTTIAAGYHPLDPTRILDSRGSNGGWNGPLKSYAAQNLHVAGSGTVGGVPASASAIVLNVTATGATGNSFVTAYPSGTPTPNVSNLNFGAGQTIANLVTVRIGSGGNVTFANARGATDLVADVVGYYDDGTGPGDLYTGIAPRRLLDSRTSNGGWNAPLVAGTSRTLTVRQPGNSNGIPTTATAVIANITVTGATAGSFLSVWPSGTPQRTASNLNFAPGQTIANLAVLKLGSDGAIELANALGAVDVIVDVVGYFDPTIGSRFHALNPTRVLDDRVPTGLSGPWGPGQTRSLSIAGATGTNVPTGATGLVANITATGGSRGSFLSVFASGGAVPISSSVNFGPGETIPNLVSAPLAGDGTIAIYNQLGTVHVIADVLGYYAQT